jgi:hypothetical protein
MRMPTPNDYFKDAITEYAADSDRLHQGGRDNQSVVPFLNQPNEPTEVREKRALQQANAGLKQLGQAAELEAKQLGLIGYAKVADLMATTAKAASKACEKIESIITANVFSAHDLTVLDRLNTTLTALAALSPAAVWTHRVPDDVEKK